MRRARRHLCAVLLALTCGGIAIPAKQTPASNRPILILISIDGWRWDYLDRYKPNTLTALALRGVRSEGLIPIFPSKTFPNHYTIVTGLYPNRHGIVLNTIIDPALPGVFSLSNVDVQQDTRWWGGVPLWVTAEQQGQVAATMFWPGADVEIAGDRPTYWRKYDGEVSNFERVDQILAWIKQPETSRPTLLTLYFSEIDSTGHDFGPETPQMAQAVAHIDAAIGRLVAGLEDAGLRSRVNLVLVSDHGMAALGQDRVIVLDDYVDPSTVVVQDWTPILSIAPRHGSVDDLYRALKDKHRALTVYKLSELPERYRLRGHPRLLPIIGIVDDGWQLTSREMLARKDFPGGDHGFDPMHQSMHGLFIATGPAFKSGLVAPRFDSIHVYALLCRVLGLRPALNDGDPLATAMFLR